MNENFLISKEKIENIVFNFIVFFGLFFGEK